MFNYSRNFPTVLKILTILSLLFGSALSPSRVLADSTITVTTNEDELNADGDCSLREAIEAANTDAAVDACIAGSGADIITLPSDIYTLIIVGDGEDENVTGDLDITDSLSINGTSSSSTIIQAAVTPGSGIDSVFHILGAIDVNLSDLTVANGYCTSCPGGGLFNDGGTLTLTNTTFTGNSADIFGGGIYNFFGTLNVINSSFAENTAGCGGGIYNESGILTVTNSTFSGNAVPCEGGGIFSNGLLTITSTTFSGNSAVDGGGVYNMGTLSVKNSTFVDNFTTTFDGAGIFNDTGNATVVNSTFSGNSAGDSGGGVYNDGNLTITNSTFSGNSAAYEGAGIYNFYHLYLKNTILANSTSGSDCYNDGGDLINSNINNLIEVNGPSGSMCGTPAVTANPMLGPLTGSPAYFPLNILSPAMNAGNDTVCAALPVSNTSQNGVTRPQGSHCDIGSFEKAPTFVDVPFSYWANVSIERLYAAGITAGCSTVPLNYCPEAPVARDQMAVFLERGIHSSSYNPPNVAPTFSDTAGNFAEDWIESLRSDGITGGCGATTYCPTSGVTRAQMAIFIERSMHGSSFTPPNVSPTFGDTAGNFAEDWIEALKNDGITSGCGGGNYCPDDIVTRAQMAVFLVKAFSLP